MTRRIKQAGWRLGNRCADEGAVQGAVTTYSRKRLLLSAVLVVLLLMMQTLSLWHHLELDAHSDGHVCELCVALGALAHSLPGTQQQPSLMHGIAVYLLAQQPSEHCFVSTPLYQTRAPPVRLLS